MRYDIHSASENLLQLIEAAARGEEVVITHGSAAVKLVPLPRKGFKLGLLEGKIGSVPDFMEPLDEEDLRLWEGG